jgi:CheY-like chemotaxis protein
MADTGSRQYFRVSPSSENPIGVKFYREPLKQISNQIKVITISVGGMGLELPCPVPELKPGLLFERIELSIPEEETCMLSGIVRFVNENRCGIKFININDFVLRKVSRYVFKREREILHIKKYKESGKNTEEPKEEDYHGGIDVEKKIISHPEGKKLLIIDDSEAIRATYKTFFSDHGFEVIQAKDGVEGIKMALTMLPDLILMDINMPVMSGLECTRIIKSYPATSHIPIVMLTTESERDAVIKAINVGAKNYIIKTSDKEFILKKIKSILEE